MESDDQTWGRPAHMLAAEAHGPSGTCPTCRRQGTSYLVHDVGYVEACVLCDTWVSAPSCLGSPEPERPSATDVYWSDAPFQRPHVITCVAFDWKRHACGSPILHVVRVQSAVISGVPYRNATLCGGCGIWLERPSDAEEPVARQPRDLTLATWTVWHHRIDYARAQQVHADPTEEAERHRFESRSRPWFDSDRWDAMTPLDQAMEEWEPTWTRTPTGAALLRTVEDFAFEHEEAPVGPPWGMPAVIGGTHRRAWRDAIGPEHRG